jgi:hypothetical protein
MPRYLAYSAFEESLDKLLLSRSDLKITKTMLGTSVDGRSIYGLKLGSGSQRVLIWSQMHGNESSTTRALMSLLEWDELSSILPNLSLYIIPVLNPDGAQRWSRNNANGVDLNRDAIDLNQPESQILHNAYQDFQPHYCLNLHGQRTIYGNAAGDQPAQISFLAPAGDENRLVNEPRLKAMQVINAMVTQLSIDADAFIGRYNDAFNRNCVGDFFTSLGTPTILFEAGHVGMDYDRSVVSSYMVEALKICLITIIDGDVDDPTANQNDQTLKKYLEIPEIDTTYCDILIKNMVSDSGKRVDLSVMYREEVIDEELHFIPCLVGVNDKGVKNAHRIIDLAEISPSDYDFSISATGVILTTSFDITIFCE